jgi:hypothetical protein
MQITCVKPVPVWLDGRAHLIFPVVAGLRTSVARWCRGVKGAAAWQGQDFAATRLSPSGAVY